MKLSPLFAATGFAVAGLSFAAPAQAQSMLGTWDVPCCAGAYHFTMKITGESGDSFSGIMINQANSEPDSTVSGRRTSSGVEFDRSGGWGSQHWVASLVNDGGRLRMTGGRWSGTGSTPSLSPEFSGVQTGGGVVVAPPPPSGGASMLGTWDVPCCAGAYHFTMKITGESGDSFSGIMINQANSEPDSTVSGRRTSSGVEFDRSGGWGSQHWVASLVNDGGRLRMTGGHWSGTGSTPSLSPEFSGVQTGGGVAAPPVQPSGASGESMLGAWTLHCCGNSYLWRMDITSDDGKTFKGGLLNMNTHQPDGHIEGRRSGGRVDFERTGPWGAQHWSADFSGSGVGQQMTNGRWSGTGSDMGASLDFHAERPDATAALPPAVTGVPGSVAGTWDLHCCGDSYHWTMRITGESGADFSGDLVNPTTGQFDTQIRGRRTGSSIAFDRSGAMGVQHWTASLVGTGDQQRMTGGRWNGVGSDMGVPLDFHAERLGAGATGPGRTGPAPGPSDQGHVDQSPPDQGHRDARDGRSSSMLYEVWNTAGCGFTDTAILPLGRAARLDRVELWYNWRASETTVAFTLLKNGQEISRGVLRRGDCDPYQAAWCVAEATVGAELEADTYAVQAAAARICQNGASQGQGFIRAYGRGE